MRTYKFRLYPTKKQEGILKETLEKARFAYNKQLEFKINEYKNLGRKISHFDLNNHLIELKQKYVFLKGIHSQVLQNINQRISFAFNNFFNKRKNNQPKGFPRFKGKNRYDSITYPQSGFSLGNKLYLSKVGDVSIVRHRKLKGKVKTLTVRKTSSGKWFACFSAEQDIIQKENKIKNNIIGIDLGLIHFYADSNKNIIDNPRCLKNSEEKLVKLQRALSRKKKSSKNRSKSRLKVARLHEKITNQRNDFLHKESRKLADLYSNIAVEDLKIRNMVKNHYLAKSIVDASWQRFLQMLAYKVEETGGKIIQVNARGTSQYCICGNKAEKTLAVRVHKCSDCGINIDRDVMSAMVIRKLAIKSTTAGSAESNAWGDVLIGMPMNQESRASS